MIALVTACFALITAKTPFATSARILGDTDRDGTISVQFDSSYRSTWTPSRGAMFIPNLDADNTGRFRTDGGHAADAIFFDTQTNKFGWPTEENFAVDNNGDPSDLTPFTIDVTIPAGSGYRTYLKLGSLAQAKSVHIFPSDAISTSSIYGGLTTQQQANGRYEVDITPYVAGSMPKYFYLEGLFFAGMKIPVGTSPSAGWLDYDGKLDLRIEVRNGSTVLASDQVQMKVAPFILCPSPQLTKKAYVFGAYPNSTIDGSADLRAKMGGNIEVISNDSDTVWLQDHAESGYYQSVTGAVPQICTVQMPYWTDHIPKWVSKSMLGPDRAFFALNCLPKKSYSYGGNLECLPPFPGNPFGVIICGSTMPSDVQSFFSAQSIQKVVTLESSFLTVGHIDELFSFYEPLAPNSPVSPQNPLRIIVADPNLALSVLDTAATASPLDLVFSLPETTKPCISGTLSVTATANTVTLTSPPPYSSGYVRIVSGTATGGQVAHFYSTSGSKLFIDRVWQTGSRVVDNGNGSGSAAYVVFNGLPSLSTWYYTPKANDQYAVAPDTKKWASFRTTVPEPPSMITLSEIKSDNLLHTLNKDISSKIAQAKSTLANLIGATSVKFIPVPVLFIGYYSNGAPSSCLAYTPGLANSVRSDNLSVICFAKPFVSSSPSGNDPFEEKVRSQIANAVFADDWNVYHRWEGEVHCATFLSKSFISTPWWTNLK